MTNSIVRTKAQDLLLAIANHDDQALHMFEPSAINGSWTTWPKDTISSKVLRRWMLHALRHNNEHAYTCLCDWAHEDNVPSVDEKMEAALHHDNACDYTTLKRWGWITTPLSWDQQLQLWNTWSHHWDTLTFSGYFGTTVYTIKFPHIQNENAKPRNKQEYDQLCQHLQHVMAFFQDHQHTPMQLVELLFLGKRRLSEGHIPKNIDLTYYTYVASDKIPKHFLSISRDRYSSEIWNNILQLHPLGDATLHLFARLHLIDLRYKWNPTVYDSNVLQMGTELQKQYPHTYSTQPLLYRWKEWALHEFKLDDDLSIYKDTRFYQVSWKLPISVVSAEYTKLIEEENTVSTMLGKSLIMMPREYMGYMKHLLLNEKAPITPLDAHDLEF